MFSGDTGAVVISGGGLATTAPTYELARDARKVIRGLPAVLFERSAKPRPCGLLCKLSAAGMLMCDVLGLPLTPFELAEPIGKEASRMADKITAEVKKEKKAAAGKGKTAQEAEADFLRRRIKLPLPSAAQIAAVLRRIEKEVAKKAMPPPPPRAAPPPQPPQLQPPSSPPPPLPPPPQDDQPPPRTRRFDENGNFTDAFLSELKSSVLVGNAINAAHHLERHVPWVYSESEGETDEEEEWTDDDEDEAAEHATVSYKYALRKLGREYPGVRFDGVTTDSTVVAGMYNSVPCACGTGLAGCWPWQLQPHTRGFCDPGAALC